MRILVLAQGVPDLVEGLEVASDGVSLDQEWLKYVLNDFDDHALEEALQLKADTGAEVVALSPETDGSRDILFTCLAKGADRAVLVPGDWFGTDNHQKAKALASLVKEIAPDLVLTGVQAPADVDGQLGVLLAGNLHWTHVTTVKEVRLADGKATVVKELEGGAGARYQVSLPAVLGIQAARVPPRYVPVSKVRQAMKTAKLEEMEAPVQGENILKVHKLYPPPSGERATMLDGDADTVAGELVRILREKGIGRLAG